MGFFSNKPPDDKLNAQQILERFRDHVRNEIDAALDGRASNFGLQRQLARALRDAAQQVDTHVALNQPLV